MLRFIVLLLVLMAGQAHAAWFEVNGFSIGTSYRPVTGTTISVTSSGTVSTSVISSSDTSVVRIVCDQSVGYGYTALLTTASIVTSTAPRLVADQKDLFTLPANSAVALRAWSTTANCNVVRMGK